MYEKACLLVWSCDLVVTTIHILDQKLVGCIWLPTGVGVSDRKRLIELHFRLV